MFALNSEHPCEFIELIIKINVNNQVDASLYISFPLVSKVPSSNK